MKKPKKTKTKNKNPTWGCGDHACEHSANKTILVDDSLLEHIFFFSFPNIIVSKVLWDSTKFLFAVL